MFIAYFVHVIDRSLVEVELAFVCELKHHSCNKCLGHGSYAAPRVCRHRDLFSDRCPSVGSNLIWWCVWWSVCGGGGAYIRVQR